MTDEQKAEFERLSRQLKTLDGLLDAMGQRGNPWLAKLGGGWHCWVEMFVSVTGSKFEIKSEYDHPTPIAAARECHQRVIDALSKLG